MPNLTAPPALAGREDRFGSTAENPLFISAVSFGPESGLRAAVGIAVSGAILNECTNFHLLALAFLHGQQAALGRLWHLAYREASTLAFADAFRAVMLALVLAATLWVRLMRNIAALPRAFEQRALERCAGLNFFIPENANVSG